MPNIKPVSDLRNYNEVLRDIDIDEPVFLTKNGRGRYAILDMREYEKTQATLKLLSQLATGEKSGRELAWLTPDEVDARLGKLPQDEEQTD
jgi:PHD/YefM family antitoxin component YafN of YafNO toxin-antitoxin module